MHTPSAITLLFALLLLLNLVSHAAAQHDVVGTRRTRMIKMYTSPQLQRKDDPVNILGAGHSPAGNPAATAESAPPSTPAAPSGTNTASTPAGSGGSSPPPAGSATNSSPSPTPTGDSSNGGGLLGGLSSALFGGSSDTDSSSNSASSPTATSTPSSTATTNSPTATATAISGFNDSTTKSPSSTSTPATLTESTSSVYTPPPPLTSAQAQQDASQSRLSKRAINIIIAVGSALGGAGIIWTIVRKWKFRPSRNFEDRLAPIDWQPSAGGSDMGEHRRYSIGGGSLSSGMDAAGVRRNMFAPDDTPIPQPDFPPAHDFTAGSALQRGPSGGHAGYGPTGYY